MNQLGVQCSISSLQPGSYTPFKVKNNKKSQPIWIMGRSVKHPSQSLNSPSKKFKMDQNQDQSFERQSQSFKSSGEESTSKQTWGCQDHSQLLEHQDQSLQWPAKEFPTDQEHNHLELAIVWNRDKAQWIRMLCKNGSVGHTMQSFQPSTKSLPTVQDRANPKVKTMDCQNRGQQIVYPAKPFESPNEEFKTSQDRSYQNWGQPIEQPSKPFRSPGEKWKSIKD